MKMKMKRGVMEMAQEWILKRGDEGLIPAAQEQSFIKNKLNLVQHR